MGGKDALLALIPAFIAILIELLNPVGRQAAAQAVRALQEADRLPPLRRSFDRDRAKTDLAEVIEGVTAGALAIANLAPSLVAFVMAALTIVLSFKASTGSAIALVALSLALVIGVIVGMTLFGGRSFYEIGTEFVPRPRWWISNLIGSTSTTAPGTSQAIEPDRILHLRLTRAELVSRLVIAANGLIVLATLIAWMAG